MTREALAVHLRLSSELPSRRHEWQPINAPIPWGNGIKNQRTPKEKAAMRARLLEMQAQGRTRREMREEFGCTGRTILLLIGRR